MQAAAPSADDGCESDLRADVDHCGACGRACSSTNVDVRGCSGSTCDSTCQPEWINCNEPTEPTPDDGCEQRSAIHPDCGGCAPMEICTDGACGAACNAAGMNALFVVDPAPDALPTLALGDQVAYDWLTTVLGFTVTAVLDSASVTGSNCHGGSYCR